MDEQGPRGRQGGPQDISKAGPSAKALREAAYRRASPPLLEEGPERFGFRGEVWTRKRVRKVIKEEFGVEYDVSQVGRILDQIGWSRQKPDHRSNRRDEQAIKEWKEEEWPRIKKSRD